MSKITQAWENAASAFTAATGKSKPDEAIQKCWLRSNKNLSVAIKEFEKAYDAAGKKLTKSTVALLEKKMVSLEKYSQQHQKELSVKTVETEDKVLARALKTLNKELGAIMLMAQSDLDQIKTDQEMGQATLENASARIYKTFQTTYSAALGKALAVHSNLKTLAEKARKDPSLMPRVIPVYNDAIKDNKCMRGLGAVFATLIKAGDPRNRQAFKDAADYGLQITSISWGSGKYDLKRDATVEDFFARLKKLKADLVESKKISDVLLKMLKDVS